MKQYVWLQYNFQNPRPQKEKEFPVKSCPDDTLCKYAHTKTKDTKTKREENSPYSIQIAQALAMQG